MRLIDTTFDRCASYDYSSGFHGFLQSNPTLPGRGSASGRAVSEGKKIHIPDVLTDQEYDYTEGQKIGGLRPVFKLEETVFSHMDELNGKFKMRATSDVAPGAHLGVHHHVGLGIRYVLSGEFTFTEGGKATVYRAGDYFFEAGNIAHTAANKTGLPLRILFVELLPRNWNRPDGYSTQTTGSRYSFKPSTRRIGYGLFPTPPSTTSSRRCQLCLTGHQLCSV